MTFVTTRNKKKLRYYRRATSTTLYKRPSALCLPVASQPDPAVHKRQRRVAGSSAATIEPQQYKQENNQVYSSPSGGEIAKTRSIAHSVNVHKMDSEGDVDQRISYLEGIINKFEKEVESDPVADGGSSRNAGSKSDIARLAKFLKPRLPPSLKSKHERPVKLKVYETTETDPSVKVRETTNPTTLEVEEITADSLEKLLNQLKKCELTSSRENMKDSKCDEMSCESEPKSEQQMAEEDSHGDSHAVHNENTKKKRSLSYNYQEISNRMAHSNNNINNRSLQSGFSNVHIARTATDRCLRANGFTGNSRTPGVLHKPPSQSLDDHCALELHRSKSYIVNLIDRALSKELGTVPAEKCDRNQFEHMTTKKAIDMVNRHTCRKIVDSDMCMEISQNIDDSLISTTGSPPPGQKCDQKNSQICVCNMNEPTYIKQLKQLRWGHLRHIQHEVRRLEDLERFLDTCGPNPSESGTF